MFRKACAISVLAVLALSVRFPPAAAETESEALAQHFVPADSPAPPPDFLFQDSNGKSFRLADFRGRPVLLNLWASWCDPCIEEMPSLDRLQAAFGKNRLLVIALDVERGGNADAATAFFKRHGIEHLGIYADTTGHISSTLHARGLPTSLLIDSEGRVLGSVMGGANWDSPASLDFLRDKLR